MQLRVKVVLLETMTFREPDGLTAPIPAEMEQLIAETVLQVKLTVEPEVTVIGPFEPLAIISTLVNAQSLFWLAALHWFGPPSPLTQLQVWAATHLSLPQPEEESMVVQLLVQFKVPP